MKTTFVPLVCSLLLFSVTSVFAQAVWKQYNGPFSGEISSFATYGDTIFAGSTMTGVFKSVDDGKTWTQTFPEITYCHSLYVHDNALFIGTDRLYKYSSAGLVQVGQSLNYAAISHMQSFNGELFVTTDYGLYQYESRNDKLVLKTEGLPIRDNVRWTRDLAVIDDVLFCNALDFGLYKSVDQGANWTKVNVAGHTYGFADMTSRGDSLICIAYNHLFVSTNKGNSWTEFTANLTEPQVFWRVAVLDDRLILTTFDDKGTYQLKDRETDWTKLTDVSYTDMRYDGNVLLASNRGGLFRWNETERAFVLSNTGINTSRVNQIELFNEKLYSATERGVHFTSTDGDEWNVVPELRESYVKTIKKSGTKLFAGTSNGLYATSATTTTWTKLENFPSVGIWDIEVANNKVYVASDDGVFVSQNGGTTWRLLPNSRSNIQQVIHLAVSDTMIIAGNTAGLFKILRDSSDWQPINFYKNQHIFSAHIIDSVLYAASMNSQVFRSFDYGTTWTYVNLPVISTIDMIKRGDNIYAAWYNKIFLSADGGTSWESVYETNTPDILITSITEGDSAFYAGTYGKSIWRRPFLSTTDIESNVYVIEGDYIYNVDPNTTVDAFKANVELGYATSLEVEAADAESGRFKSTSILRENDKIKIIAEDGKNVRTLTVSNEARVTAIEETKGNTITAFPIPASDKLFFANPERIKSCIVINSVGVKILQPTLEQDHINVQDLPRGLYVLTVVTKTNKRESLKFIKE